MNFPFRQLENGRSQQVPLDSLKEGGPKRWLQEFAGNISGPYLCDSVLRLLFFFWFKEGMKKYIPEGIETTSIVYKGYFLWDEAVYTPKKTGDYEFISHDMFDTFGSRH